MYAGLKKQAAACRWLSLLVFAFYGLSVQAAPDAVRGGLSALYDINNAADRSFQLGDYVQAEVQYRQALQVTRSYWGAQHRRVETILDRLARVYELQNRRPEQEQALRDLIAHQERVYGKNSRAMVDARMRLSRLWDEMGKRPSSSAQQNQRARWLQDNARIEEKVYGRNHPKQADNAFLQGELAAEQQHWAEARQHYEQALEIWQRTVGKNHPNVRHAYEALLDVAEAMHDTALMRYYLDQLQEMK